MSRNILERRSDGVLMPTPGHAFNVFAANCGPQVMGLIIGGLTHELAEGETYSAEKVHTRELLVHRTVAALRWVPAYAGQVTPRDHVALEREIRDAIFDAEQLIDGVQSAEPALIAAGVEA